MIADEECKLGERRGAPMSTECEQIHFLHYRFSSTEIHHMTIMCDFQNYIIKMSLCIFKHIPYLL